MNKQSQIKNDSNGLKMIIKSVKTFFFRLNCKLFHRKRYAGVSFFDIEYKNTGSHSGLFIFCMLLLPILQFLVFWVYVNINSILYAFKTSESSPLTFENFAKVFALLKTPNSDIGKAVLNTLKFFPVNNFVVLPLAVFFAYCFFRKISLGGVFRVVFFLPTLISAVVLGNFFMSVIDPGGPMNYVWEKIFDGDYPKFLYTAKTAMPTVLFYVVWTGLGYNILLVTGAVFRIPESIFESAQIEGCGFFREFFSLVVPLIGSTITMLFVTGTASVLTTMGPILILTPNGGPERSTGTIAWYIYDQVALNEYFFPSALGLVFTVICMPIVLIVKKVLEKIFPDVDF